MVIFSLTSGKSTLNPNTKTTVTLRRRKKVKRKKATTRKKTKRINQKENRKPSFK